MKLLSFILVIIIATSCRTLIVTRNCEEVGMDSRGELIYECEELQ